MMLVLLATLGVLAYASFLLRPSNHGDVLPFALVITAETWLIAQALLALWTILSSGYDARDFSYHQARRNLFGSGPASLPVDPSRRPMYLNGEPTSVDVFITTYGEGIRVIRRTVRAALAMRGKHHTIVRDDGKSDQVRELAADLGAGYVRRAHNTGAKAGNVNHGLSLTDGELFVILDADFAPKLEFPEVTLPYFAADKVAFVQSPQAYATWTPCCPGGRGTCRRSSTR